MLSLNAWIQRQATGRAVLLFLIPAQMIYFVMLMITLPEVQQFALDNKLFDLSPGGYSYEHAVRLLSNLGETGRDVYLKQQLPLDFIYPALFAISSALLLSWVLVKRHPKESMVFILIWVPIAAGVFDYLENVQIIRMLLNFPEISHQMVRLSSTMTILKSGFTTAFFFILLYGLIRLVWPVQKRSEKI